MKKILVYLLMVLVMLLSAACNPSNGQAKTVATVVTEENAIGIVIEEVDGTPTLLEVMRSLESEGKLTFTVDATGMITGMNGKQNASDWSAWWGLYISDAELSDMSYGIEWNGTQLGFSNFGANTLTVEAGGIYVWSYQTLN